MEQYLKERERQTRLSGVTGVILTVAMHGALVVCCFFTGLKYLDPPPPEKEQILIEFEEPEIEKPRQTWNGTRPQAVKPDPSKEINLVQRSEAQNEGTKANEAPEATVGEKGDVEVPEPKREKEINRRALFSAADNKTQKDTLAAQTARQVSDALKAGHASGNTKTGETSGEPNAKVAGRTVIGALPKPAYPIQQSGKVVVAIVVNQKGMVTQARAGAEGTTITNKEIWEAAKKAALNAQFTPGASPVPQNGTITYIFKLN